MEDGSRGGQFSSLVETNTEDVDEKVKESCREQREALPGEPKCIVCGHYGEYICDETDDDVCSLECKQTVLRRVASSQRQVIVPPSKIFPAVDECFYVREDVSGSFPLSNGQTELLRSRLQIHVKQASVPSPILSFSSCDLPRKLLQNLEAAGYDMPTPVQMQAIPAAIAGKSLLVSAETGSGKTASFLIPIISRCTNARFMHSIDRKNPLAIVMTPTRELCIQVEEQAKLLGEGLPFKTALVVGGEAMAGQLHRIQQGVELIVGTPGRLIDLLTKHDVALENVIIFALDEVDCMLQKDFQDQVMQIFLALSQPQVLMYSATISADIEKMVKSMAKDVAVVSVGKPNQPNKAVKQVPIWVESKQKKQKLFDILTSKQHFMPPIAVYVGSRLGADLLSNAITVTTGVKALSIHGDMSMKERREVMRSFLMDEIPVIVATGVLGRGVDLLRVRQVIVFDMPNSMKEYVHQIGRASRLGEQGMAMVFVNEENKHLFPEFVEFLKSSGAAIPRKLVNSRYTLGSFTGCRNQKKRKNIC